MHKIELTDDKSLDLQFNIVRRERERHVLVIIWQVQDAAAGAVAGGFSA